jgi:hypothetical protein
MASEASDRRRFGTLEAMADPLRAHAASVVVKAGWICHADETALGGAEASRPGRAAGERSGSSAPTASVREPPHVASIVGGRHGCCVSSSRSAVRRS